MGKVPRHIGVIPDGNRRWAMARGLPKESGYAHGLNPGRDLMRLCREVGVRELTFYGFTADNMKRPACQTRAFQRACVDAAERIRAESASFRVLGNTSSSAFPEELLPYAAPQHLGDDGMKVNLLVNYGWEWDLGNLLARDRTPTRKHIVEHLNSADISRIDLIIRWGGQRRLSGFLPVQSIYSDFYVVDDYWPDFEPDQFFAALDWYQRQDVTLGG